MVLIAIKLFYAILWGKLAFITHKYIRRSLWSTLTLKISKNCEFGLDSQLLLFAEFIDKWVYS